MKKEKDLSVFMILHQIVHMSKYQGNGMEGNGGEWI